MIKGKQIESLNQIVFCDSIDNQFEDCQPCPIEAALCLNGKIIECEDNFQLINHEKCINIEDLNELCSEMTDYIYKLLSEINGSNLCYNQGRY